MEHTPDEKLLEEQLNNLQPSPSPRFYRRMARAAWTPAAISRRRAYVVTGLTLMFAAALLVFTPQGRAWAQEVLHFFSRAESDVLPLLPEQMTAIARYYEETSTPIVETVTPNPEAGFVFNLSVAEAGQQAGFDVMVPTWVPGILSFVGASYQPEHNIVRLFYQHNQYPDIGNGLVLREERFKTIDDCKLCGVVGASEPIETVTIGGTTGEYITGVWIFTDKGPVWESTPYLKTLRWQANGLAFELIYMGIPDVENGVTKADMITIAESMMK
jgi:hypothetical protein